MLDPALIRPGRMNIKREFGYVNNEMFIQFIKLFYETDICLESNQKIIPNISVS